MLTSIVGADFSRQAGDVADVPADEAHRLVAAGYAEPLDERADEPQALETPEKPKRRRGR